MTAERGEVHSPGDGNHTPQQPNAMSDVGMRFERTQALAGIIWILGCWALVAYCFDLGDFGLAVGAAFASLALPVALPVTHVSGDSP